MILPAGERIIEANHEVLVRPLDREEAAMTSWQTGWNCCSECAVMFYNGYPTKGSCPGNAAQHLAHGPTFTLPHDGPETGQAQRDWKFCRRCFAMHWSRAAIQACDLGGSHDSTGSWNFVLPHSTPETPTSQSSWRFCSKCADMFWEPARLQRCSGGGRHDAQGQVFTLPRASHG